ncbi:MAG: glycosyltransferase family 4 protein [Lachnospiraceae bacterium]|nr:glycosyltransferase family 4 protein [Lachnospiraceae bacterium]
MKVLLVDQIAKVNYKYTFPLANGLEKHGAKVCLVIDQKQEDENCGCRKIRLFNTDEKNIGKIRKLTNYLSSYRYIVKLLKTEKFDILHTEWYTFSPIDYLFISLIKKHMDIRYVATIHDILPFNQKFYDMYFHRKLYASADSIILQAPSNMERFTKLFPELKDKTTMVPHGHMLDYIEKCSCEEAREKLNLPKEKTILLFFGQIKKVKGVDILLKAFAKIKGQHPELLLVVAGSVWKADFTACEEIIQANDFADSLRTDIRYIPDDQVKYYYSAADITVLPYTDVYQSGVIQLAYGYSKPVVATALPAFTQFVTEGNTGFIAEPGDVDSLADALLRAVERKDELEQIGIKGNALVRDQLDWNELAKRIIDECYAIK